MKRIGRVRQSRRRKKQRYRQIHRSRSYVFKLGARRGFKRCSYKYRRRKGSYSYRYDKRIGSYSYRYDKRIGSYSYRYDKRIGRYRRRN